MHTRKVLLERQQQHLERIAARRALDQANVRAENLENQHLVTNLLARDQLHAAEVEEARKAWQARQWHGPNGQQGVLPPNFSTMNLPFPPPLTYDSNGQLVPWWKVPTQRVGYHSTAVPMQQAGTSPH
jgi:hypothetical protein